MTSYDSEDITARVTKRSTDKVFILSVVNRATAYTGKRLLRSDIENLIAYIKEVDFNLVKHESQESIVDKVARNFAQQLRSRGGYTIDSHEVMKRHIGSVVVEDDDTVFTHEECPPFNPRVNPADINVIGMTEQFIDVSDHRPSSEEEDIRNRALYGVRGPSELLHEPEKYPRIAKQPIQNMYLLLDSKYRNLSTDPSVFNWTVLHSANTVQGTVNTLADNIHNIVTVQFDNFQIPYVASADNVYRKITLSIDEFDTMSVLMNTGRRYHMLFGSEIVGNQIELTPNRNDDGRFRFYTPINILDTLTLRFQSPFTPVTFQQDRYVVSVSAVSAVLSTITFPVDHHVSDGELVYLEEYMTAAPSIDNVQISLVNSEGGHIVSFISNTVLGITINLTTLAPTTVTGVKCFIASRRLIIPLRFEYLV